MSRNLYPKARNERFKMLQFLVSALLLIIVSTVSAIAQQNSSNGSAEQRLEGLLAAMGGRAAWASLAGVRVTAMHHTSDQRLPFKNVIWNDFQTPRFRVEATSAEINRAFVWQKNGAAAWAKRENAAPRPLNENESNEQARWWESNPYRTLQRLAARDPELSVRLVEPDRLGVFRRNDGVRLCWFRLNQMNEPVAFSAWDSETGTIFGPLKESKSGARHPKWVASADGRWRVELLEFAAYREKINVETAPPKTR
jgi:hypothetical protein